MLGLITWLDGFHSRGNVRVILAANRPSILDLAFVRPCHIAVLPNFGPIREPDATSSRDEETPGALGPTRTDEVGNVAMFWVGRAFYKG